MSDCIVPSPAPESGNAKEMDEIVGKLNDALNLSIDDMSDSADCIIKAISDIDSIQIILNKEFRQRRECLLVKLDKVLRDSIKVGLGKPVEII